MPMPRTHKALTRADRFSQEAIRQQQLAWFLYISEGFAENLRHALAVNNFCMYSDDLAAVKTMLVNVQANIADMRSTFFPE